MHDGEGQYLLISVENIFDHVLGSNKQPVTADVEACPYESPSTSRVVCQKRERVTDGIRQRAVLCRKAPRVGVRLTSN